MRTAVKHPAVLMLAVSIVLGVRPLRSHQAKPAAPSHDETAAAHPLAPDFSLTDLSGRRLDLSAYRGKLVLLNFWATWCSPCRIEIPQFIELQNKYRDKGLRIVGISLDEDDKPVRAFYRRLKMNYPVAIGDVALAERFGGILGLPVSFFIGCDGRLNSRHTGLADISVIEKDIVRLLHQEGCTPGDPGS
jgi:cytochrome c biogenesis protein CcmG/thiol:disulfide interchange protein DsbE